MSLSLAGVGVQLGLGLGVEFALEFSWVELGLKFYWVGFKPGFRVRSKAELRQVGLGWV